MRCCLGAQSAIESYVASLLTVYQIHRHSVSMENLLFAQDIVRIVDQQRVKPLRDSQRLGLSDRNFVRVDEDRAHIQLVHVHCYLAAWYLLAKLVRALPRLNHSVTLTEFILEVPGIQYVFLVLL